MKQQSDSHHSEQIFDAIADVRDALVEQAADVPQKRRRRRWPAATAAVLAVAILGGVLLYPFGGNGGLDMAAYAIAEATYPEMVQYPDEAAFFEALQMLQTQLDAGEITEEEFYTESDALNDALNEQYNAWFAARRAQRDQPEGYAESLDSFFQASIAQFLSGAETENRVYSPVNVYMALSMLAELTGGESRTQILSLLGSDDIASLRKQAAAVWNANYSNDGALTSLLAGSVWLDTDVSFDQTPLETLAEVYHASSYQGEMGSEEMNRLLRGWLNEQTGGLLEEQVSSLALDADTVLALATTIYFRAKWVNEFNEANTEADVFHGAAGDQSADFMHATRASYYYWGEQFSAAALSLDVGGTMWLILPDEGVSTDALLADAEAVEFLRYAEGYAEDWENSKFLTVNFSVPKFDVSGETDLTEGLRALGVTDAFDLDTADFSPLSDKALCVSKALHGARVAIDEEGVTAAAYTVMGLVGASMPPTDEVDFVLNRPFLFLVTGETGQPLFAGVVNQP